MRSRIGNCTYVCRCAYASARQRCKATWRRRESREAESREGTRDKDSRCAPTVDGIQMCTFLDGYCSTVQGLLDWFEVDLGFTEQLLTVFKCACT